LTIQINGQHWVHKTQDEDKQNKNTTQYVLDTTIRKRTQITDNIIITLYRGFVFRHDSWKFAHGAFNNNHSFITISYTKLTERLKISNKQYIFKVNRTCRYYRQIETFNLTVFTSRAVDRGFEPCRCRVEPKTIKLVFAASLQNTQH
jgi:hypothetical protein